MFSISLFFLLLYAFCWLWDACSQVWAGPEHQTGLVPLGACPSLAWYLEDSGRSRQYYDVLILDVVTCRHDVTLPYLLCSGVCYTSTVSPHLPVGQPPGDQPRVGEAPDRRHTRGGKPQVLC